MTASEPHAPRPSESVSRTWLTRSEWLLLLALAAVQFTHLLDFMIVMPLGPQYLREMSLSPRQFSFMVSAYGFSAGLSGLLAAFFIDRFDRKRALLALYAGFTAGTILCAIAPGFFSLLVGRVVAGAFGGVVAAAILTIVGDVFPDVRRALATGVIMSAFSVASIVGVPVGLWLADLLGWRAPFQILGLLSGVVWIVIAQTMPSLSGHLQRGEQARPTLWQVLTMPAHVRAYILTISLVVSSFTVAPFLAAYLEANVGCRPMQLPYVYLCGGLATLATMTPIGRLADRYGKLFLFRILALAAVVPVVVITNLPAVALPWILLVTTLFMVLTSGRWVPATAMITASAQPLYRGSFLSVNASVQQMAAGLAAQLAGAIVGEDAAGRLTGYPLVGWIAAGTMALSLFLAGRLRSVEAEVAAPTFDDARELVPALSSAE